MKIETKKAIKVVLKQKKDYGKMKGLNMCYALSLSLMFYKVRTLSTIRSLAYDISKLLICGKPSSLTFHLETVLFTIL